MTGFKGVRNVNGRPKGSLNKSTAETKELIHNVVSKQLENIDKLLDRLEPKERIDAIIKLLPYLIPKQSEITTNESEPQRKLVIRINRSSE
ncbi:hypothetical protein K5L04_01870 [Flavobacterium psychrophilum]|uniref:hypothetical protein n=1 Tax=Flavobacterium psychrophilum TaxID=96345 RepID=UPI0004F8BA7D|nr:hypothetical protein [Flavobacterium psychrophilum]AIN71919.1 hypothetical protein FPG101_08460 [Flavobacterium psychrophilum FPG101]EKT3963763.1 hypothetical protein [Flavobacterium psychrophilum]EKT4517232.1 hypothetical protein [Flavobacterium psychrophilum]EKT4520388.1 hypothetical protein [Flavobacterium psychrophilum]EKT4534711.1 hypothetical protein [Flavobacterium psychrophilum]